LFRGVVYNVDSMVSRTDEEIALAVQKGDVESFGILVERFEAKLLRFGRKFLTDRQDIEDLVQEVFIKAYSNIQSFDVERRFSPWIYRIAHNEFVNALKKKSRLPFMLFDFDTIFPHPFAKETADAEVNEKELRGMLSQSLEHINPKYREPLVLHYIEELDYQEIAEILHIPMSTVGVRIYRAKTMLKKILHG